LDSLKSDKLWGTQNPFAHGASAYASSGFVSPASESKDEEVVWSWFQFMIWSPCYFQFSMHRDCCEIRNWVRSSFICRHLLEMTCINSIFLLEVSLQAYELFRTIKVWSAK
jgi:hypothetical protein